MHFLVGPTRISSEEGKVTGLQCIRMKLGEPDDSGRRRPVPIPESEFFAEADTVIAAVGQAADLSFLPPDSALERSRWERLVVDSNNLGTNVPGVFAGGDFVFGPGMIIEAIAGGRRGALAIDKYLRGDNSRVQMYDIKQPVIKKADRPTTEEGAWEAAFRPEMPMLPVEERKQSFKETELGFSEEKARCEAKRCLRCDLET
jgi:formate dehydrogenase beta subunit